MKIALIFAAIISSAVASLVIYIYIALQHNPMEAYCMGGYKDDCKLNIPNIAGLWISWFVVSFVIQVICIVTAKYLFKWLLNKPLRRMR